MNAAYAIIYFFEITSVDSVCCRLANPMQLFHWRFSYTPTIGLHPNKNCSGKWQSMRCER